MSGAKLKILIVDDDPVNLQLLEGALKFEYEIITARNGFDAIEQVKRKRPDLILLDVMMPDISGFDVCRIIKAEKQFSSIHIIFLTALDTVEAEIKGFEIGGIDYISKPINIELLKHRVHNHLELKCQYDLICQQNELLCRQKEELEESLAQIKRLEGVIPICMYCKKIRDDKNSWSQLESYISEHSEAKFSHGACPDCLEEQLALNKIQNILRDKYDRNHF